MAHLEIVTRAGKERALKRVQAAAIEEAEAKEALKVAVAHARTQGATWLEIAHFLGLTERQARRLFGATPPPTEQATLF